MSALRPAAAISTGQGLDEHSARDVAQDDDTDGGALMPGGPRLPGGEPRKASQKRSRPAAPIAAVAPASALRPGDRVRWSRYTGTVQRVLGDVADVRQDGRNSLWRLPMSELTKVVG
jgi:hypothetical protein